MRIGGPRMASGLLEVDLSADGKQTHTSLGVVRQGRCILAFNLPVSSYRCRVQSANGNHSTDFRERIQYRESVTQVKEGGKSKKGTPQ